MSDQDKEHQQNQFNSAEQPQSYINPYEQYQNCPQQLNFMDSEQARLITSGLAQINPSTDILAQLQQIQQFVSQQKPEQIQQVQQVPEYNTAATDNENEKGSTEKVLCIEKACTEEKTIPIPQAVPQQESQPPNFPISQVVPQQESQPHNFPTPQVVPQQDPQPHNFMQIPMQQGFPSPTNMQHQQMQIPSPLGAEMNIPQPYMHTPAQLASPQQNLDPCLDPNSIQMQQIYALLGQQVQPQVQANPQMGLYPMMGGVNPGFSFPFAQLPGTTQVGISSAASFHQPAAVNEIKLFVGGLAFPTTEEHLHQYFSNFGKVINTIVMRDRATQRGRGFGFVLVQFVDQEAAQKYKQEILATNLSPGHLILEKRVDVKSADDYQGKGSISDNLTNMGAMGQSFQPQPPGILGSPQIPHLNKPNPYVQVTQVDGKDQTQDVTYSYPKSKVFVGGLDFNLTSEELREHFSTTFGEVQDAIILKDIYTGKSRGFGFVTFKEEAIAQKLINEVTYTEINKRKIDIKKAEPKAAGSYQPIPGKPIVSYQPNNEEKVEFKKQQPIIEKRSRSSSKENRRGKNRQKEYQHEGREVEQQNRHKEQYQNERREYSRQYDQGSPDCQSGRQYESKYDRKPRHQDQRDKNRGSRYHNHDRHQNKDRSNRNNYQQKHQRTRSRSPKRY